MRFFTMKNIRSLVQGLFLLFFLFLFIQTESKGNDELGYPVRLFLDFDPLILVSTLLSAHAAAKAFYFSRSSPSSSRSSLAGYSAAGPVRSAR